MLLEFKTRNYKSFVDEMSFSMVPAPKQKGLDYSVMSIRAGSQIYRGICSAVIYGPNASGKTNIIGAMDTFRAIVLRGNIRDTEILSPNAAASSLELIPNCSGPQTPTEFAIRYVDESLMIDYALTIDLGTFLNADYQRKILDERLSVNEKTVFHRNGVLMVNLPAAIRPYINRSIRRKTQKLEDLARDSLSDTELFLTNGFKSIYAQELVNKIQEWFSTKFIVVVQSDDLRVVKRFANPRGNTVYIEKTLTEAARIFGITGNALGYKASGDQEGEDMTLYSLLGEKMLPADMFESYGTIRFINEFPLVIYALLNGGTLIMDEFDASIHPMALMNIINIFHNDEINSRHAQLIFNTHNPIFLDSSLLRRDEIKFVERDESTGQSIHYALSDFRTADGIRKGEDYMNNYFVSRYGATREIDFSSIVEAIITAQEQEDNEVAEDE